MAVIELALAWFFLLFFVSSTTLILAVLAAGITLVLTKIFSLWAESLERKRREG